MMKKKCQGNFAGFQLSLVIPGCAEGAGPETILPIVVMDSGLARLARAPE
jgi:hypothetical protein